MKIQGIKCNVSVEFAIDSIELTAEDYEGFAKCDKAGAEAYTERRKADVIRDMTNGPISDMMDEIKETVTETLKAEIRQQVKQANKKQ